MSFINLEISNIYLVRTLRSVHVRWLKIPENLEEFEELFIEQCQEKYIFGLIGFGDTFTHKFLEIRDEDTEEIERYRDIFNNFLKLGPKINEEINKDTWLEPFNDDFPILFVHNHNPDCYVKQILEILDDILEGLTGFNVDYADINSILVYKNGIPGDDTLICTANPFHP